jgi:ADP-ribose pyrophosphatase YjhB (NUDIX family)
MAKLQDRDGYASFDMHVVAAGDHATVVPLAIWASPEEDSDVIALAVTFPEGHELVGIAADTALHLADALDLAVDAEVAVTDHGTAPAEPAALALSFDDEGCEVLFVLSDTTRRLVLDRDEAREIAAALRRAVAYLAAAAGAVRHAVGDGCLAVHGEGSLSRPAGGADVSALAEQPRAVDAAVYADGHLLLVDQGDGWALPGGLAGVGESDVDAMVRQLRDGIGIDLVREVAAVVYSGPADDRHVAAEVWVTSRLTVFRLDRLPQTARPPAARAGWFPVRSLDELAAAIRAVGGALGAALLPLLEIVLKHLGGPR